MSININTVPKAASTATSPNVTSSSIVDDGTTVNISEDVDVTGVVSATSFTGAGTGLIGTASSLTSGNVTTNANLTGVITSSGNATSIASQTGTGSKFVVDTSPTIIELSTTGILNFDDGLITTDGSGALDVHGLTADYVQGTSIFNDDNSFIVDNGGNVTAGDITANSIVVEPVSDIVSLTVKAFNSTSQTSKIQEWQNSVGTPLAFVDKNGNLTALSVTVGSGTSGGITAFNFTVTNSTQTNVALTGNMQIISPTDGHTPIQVRGTASQTGDLQQWYNSAGVIATSINAVGVLKAKELQTPNGSPQFRVDDSGNLTTAQAYIGGATAESSMLFTVATGNLFKVDTNGNCIATSFSGDGSALTDIVATTVDTNADMTGDVTSVGNATTLDHIPAISGASLTALPLDSGWTSNADVGDKTSVIPDNATFAGFVTALDLVAAGLGSAIEAMSDKIKALETALAISKLPNA